MRRLLVVATVAMLAGMALAGCTNNGTNQNQTGTTPTSTITAPGAGGEGGCAAPLGGNSPPRPNTDKPAATGSAATKDVFVVMGGAGEPESFDPAFAYDSASGQILNNAYETLYTYENTSAIKLKPVLAAGPPECNDDGTVLTIPLRANVTFHDGQPLTAEDVKFSLDRIILMNDPHGPAIIYKAVKGAQEYFDLDITNATQANRDTYLAAGGVKIIDPLTVQITLAYPDASFLYRLAFYGASIVSKEAFCANKPTGAGNDCLPPPGQTRHDWADTNIAGSGPFKLNRWQKGTEVVLDRFDGYWGDKPAMKTVIVKNVNDFNTRLLALKNGEADDVYIPVDHDVDVKDLAGIEIVEDPSWSVSFLGLNQKFCGGPGAANFDKCMTDNADSVPKGADGTPDPLFFSDIHMRRAWAYAFDYEAYLDTIVNGHGRLLDGVLPQGIFGFDSSIKGPRQDIEKAKAELALTNHSDGFSITIFYNTGNTVREKTAQLFAQNLQDAFGANVQVSTRGLDFTTQSQKTRQLALPVFYLGWLPDYAFPDNYLEPFAHSQNGNLIKRIGYANTSLDAKLDTLFKETDQDKLTAGYRDVVRSLNDDFAYIWLAQASNYHVQRDWVNGYYYNPMQSGSPLTGDFSTITKV